jgi:hypothetical protein
MILMMLMTNFENLPNRKNDKSSCVHKRNNLVESVDLPDSLHRIQLVIVRFSLFQQIKDKQLQYEESRDQDDSGNGADIDVQEH